MAILVSQSFTATNGTKLVDYTEGGFSWVANSNSAFTSRDITIQSNELVANPEGGSDFVLNSYTPSTPDADTTFPSILKCRLTRRDSGSPNYVAPTWRGNTTTNQMWYLKLDEALAQWHLVKVVSGTATTTNTQDITLPPVNQSIEVEIRNKAERHEIYVNGSSLFSITDAAHNNKNRYGVRAVRSASFPTEKGVTLDNWTFSDSVEFSGGSAKTKLPRSTGTLAKPLFLSGGSGKSRRPRGSGTLIIGSSTPPRPSLNRVLGLHERVVITGKNKRAKTRGIYNKLTIRGKR